MPELLGPAGASFLFFSEVVVHSPGPEISTGPTTPKASQNSPSQTRYTELPVRRGGILW